MNCLESETLLQETLDRRQAELPTDLSAHLAECSSCREFWSHLQRVQQSVATWSQPTSAASLANRVLPKLAADLEATSETQIVSTRPACSPLAGLSVLLASAAALFIAVGIGWRVSSNATFANRQPPSAVRLVSHPTESVATSERQLDALLNDAREAYVSLASQAWQDVVTADVLLPPTDAATSFGTEPADPTGRDLFSKPLIPFSQELQDAWDSWMHQVFQNQDSST